MRRAHVGGRKPSFPPPRIASSRAPLILKYAKQMDCETQSLYTVSSDKKVPEQLMKSREMSTEKNRTGIKGNKVKQVKYPLRDLAMEAQEKKRVIIASRKFEASFRGKNMSARKCRSSMAKR